MYFPCTLKFPCDKWYMGRAICTVDLCKMFLIRPFCLVFLVEWQCIMVLQQSILANVTRVLLNLDYYLLV